ncbi:hypothetical protein [Pontixanthobacter aquaemixtae]|uniref:Uncharacterized protein n=1 Tax=Pontixanthobacter aquaemixtae TaxID=1958940 RepID=A0A844ZTX6_9SPHN|nr:hypothetical protein [Pontixanthobacter aquaemixtae]MXO91188.1 hypothetical protein [Pontixanthobacter aquaemixtae]
MSSFLSRNGLVALVALGIIMFGVSHLVGSEGEDGVLMRAAKDFTGEETEEAVEAPKPAQPAEVAAPAAPPPSPVVEGDFYEDNELIDAAAGFDPTPTDNTEQKSELESDEALIISQTDAKPSGVADQGNAVVNINDGDIIQ